MRIKDILLLVERIIDQYVDDKGKTRIETDENSLYRFMSLLELKQLCEGKLNMSRIEDSHMDVLGPDRNKNRRESALNFYELCKHYIKRKMKKRALTFTTVDVKQTDINELTFKKELYERKGVPFSKEEKENKLSVVTFEKTVNLNELKKCAELADKGTPPKKGKMPPMVNECPKDTIKATAWKKKYENYLNDLEEYEKVMNKGRWEYDQQKQYIDDFVNFIENFVWKGDFHIIKKYIYATKTEQERHDLEYNKLKNNFAKHYHQAGMQYPYIKSFYRSGYTRDIGFFWNQYDALVEFDKNALKELTIKRIKNSGIKEKFKPTILVPFKWYKDWSKQKQTKQYDEIEERLCSIYKQFDIEISKLIKNVWIKDKDGILRNYINKGAEAIKEEQEWKAKNWENTDDKNITQSQAYNSFSKLPNEAGSSEEDKLKYFTEHLPEYISSIVKKLNSNQIGVYNLTDNHDSKFFYDYKQHKNYQFLKDNDNENNIIAENSISLAKRKLLKNSEFKKIDELVYATIKDYLKENEEYKIFEEQYNTDLANGISTILDYNRKFKEYIKIDKIKAFSIIKNLFIFLQTQISKMNLQSYQGPLKNPENLKPYKAWSIINKCITAIKTNNIEQFLTIYNKNNNCFGNILKIFYTTISETYKENTLNEINKEENIKMISIHGVNWKAIKETIVNYYDKLKYYAISPYIFVKPLDNCNTEWFIIDKIHGRKDELFKDIKPILFKDEQIKKIENDNKDVIERYKKAYIDLVTNRA